MAGSTKDGRDGHVEGEDKPQTRAEKEGDEEEPKPLKT